MALAVAGEEERMPRRHSRPSAQYRYEHYDPGK
jgi:hypothetical protein